jgi:hypothetical protein
MPREMPIRISATNETAQAAAATRSDLRSIAKEANQASRALEQTAKDQKGFLDSLKESFGRGSTLGQMAKLFAGGGAIMGLKFATAEIAHMAEAGEHLATALRKGDGNAGELAQEFAKSIPIVGNLVAAGASINEMITGDKLAMSELNAESEKQIKISKDMATGYQRSKESLADMVEQFKDIQFEGMKGGANPGIRELLDAVDHIEKRAQKISAESHKGINAILNPTGEKSLAELASERAKLDRDIAATTIPEPTMGGVNSGGGAFGNVQTQGVTNYAEIDSARKALDAQKASLNDLDRMIDARKSAAKPLQDQAWKNVTEDFRSQLKTLAETGRESGGKFWASFQKGITEHMDLARDLAGQIKASKLAAVGDSLGAQMAEIERQQYRADAAARAKYGAGAGDIIAANKAVRDEATEAAKRSHAEQIERAGHQARMDMYQAEASAGDSVAAKKANAMEIEERYHERIRETQKLMDSVGTSAAEREHLGRVQGGLRGAELIELLHATSSQALLNFGPKSESFGNSGITDLARDTVSQNPAAAAIKDLTAKVDAILSGKIKGDPSYFDALWQSLKRNFPQLNDADSSPLFQ